MRVWTNGSLHAARNGKGLFLFRGTQLVRHLELAPAGGEGNDELFAITPSGSHAWVGGLRRLSLEEGAEPSGPLAEGTVVDLVSLDEERIAAVLAAARGKPARLVVGQPGAAWELDRALVAEQATRAEVPDVLGPGGGWSEALRVGEGAQTREVRVHAGPHGIAVACRRTGLVGVFRPGSEGAMWLRLPVREQARVDAAATEGGVLVTVVLGGQQGLTAHFDAEGRCQGHTGATARSVGAALLAGGRFALFDEARGGRVKVFDAVECRDLHPRARLSLSEPPLDVAVSGDGRWVVFGGEQTLSIFELGDKRLALVGALTPSDVLRETTAKAREKSRIEQGAQYKRAEGAPSLGFPASKAPVMAWEARLGDEFDVALALRSTGGAGRGVAVEISGPALSEGLVEPVSVSIGGHEASPEAGGAGLALALPSVEIPQGMVFPFDPKPKSPEQLEKAQALLAATHLALGLRLSAKKAGVAMMTVAARPLGGTAAPMKWTRPVTVRPPE